MDASHATRPALCAASPTSANRKESHHVSPKAADEAKKRGERVDKTGRNKKSPRHVRVFGWLLSSTEWRALSCADRATLLAILAAYNGSNNGAIRMGARRLAGARRVEPRNTDALSEKGRSAAAERLKSLAKAGMIVATNTPSKGNFEHRREAEWLLPFLPDSRKGAQPTPFTEAWEGRASQKPPFFQLYREVIDTAAWSALSDAAQVLMVHLGVEAMKRDRWQRIDPLTLSMKEMAEMLNVSHDTAHRAFRDLEAKGFVMRHRDGRALIGKRTTGSFSVDWLACRPEPGVVHGARRRYTKWKPGDDFSAPTVAANQPRRARPTATIAEPAALEATIAVRPRPEDPASTTAKPSIATTEPIASEKDIDLTDPRIASHLIKGLHYATLDRFGKSFPMNDDHVQMAICTAADYVGPVNAVATFRAIALDAIAKAVDIKDVAPAITATIRALQPAKAAKRQPLAAAVAV